MELKTRLRATVAAAQAALTEASAALSLVLEDDPDPDPAPAPPAPVPEPSPPAPEPVAVLLERLDPPNLAQLIALEAYYRVTSSYDRFPEPFFLRGASMQIPVVGLDGLTVTRRNLPLGEYVLQAMAHGSTELQTIARLTISTSTPRAVLVADLSGLDRDKSHKLMITGPAGWTALPMWANFAGGSAPTVPFVRANYDFLHDRKPYHYGLVSASAEPTPRPLALIEAPPVLVAAQTNVRFEHLVPWEEYDTYRKIRTADGWTTVNQQSYNFAQLVAKKPPLPELDGPRGVGNFRMATDIVPSHSGGAWACNPWRCVNVSSTGHVKTLFGWRHNAETGALELVGDWDEPPPAGLEFWRFVFDPRTLPRGGDPIDVGGGVMMQPHLVNPVAFAFASQANTIYRVEFDRLDPTLTKPPKVTRFLIGLADPFGGDCRDGLLYVTERMAHRISVWDIDTRALVDVLASGRALSTVTTEGRLVAPLPGQILGSAMMRAEPCVGPEGAKLRGDWLYFGSRSQAQVRRVHVKTKAVEVVVENCRVDGNSHFINIALGDETFGGESVFYDSWSSDNTGRPFGLQGSFNSSFSGPGRPWDTLGYGCAVAVGNGRLYCSSASNGLTVHYAKRADDVVIQVEQWRAWRKAWAEDAFDILCGDEGCGGLGQPLPWGGRHDAFLLACGHKQGER